MHVRWNPLLVAASAALVLSAAATATAAVVRSPGDSASSVVWDENALFESSLEGLGLVYDILDVIGLAPDGSEFDCDDCEIAFAGPHDSFSPSGSTGGGSGGGSGWGGPWNATPPASKPADAPKTSNLTATSHASGNTSSGSGAGPIDAPPSLTTSDAPAAGGPPLTFVTAPACTDCVTTTDEPTTTRTDDGGADGGGAAAVPEPGSMFLLGTGMLGLAVAVRRRWRR